MSDMANLHWDRFRSIHDCISQFNLEMLTIPLNEKDPYTLPKCTVTILINYGMIYYKSYKIHILEFIKSF